MPLASLFAAVFLALAGGGLGQDEARLTAQLSSGVIELDKRASITVVLEGVRSARIVDVPEVEGLALGAPTGPSTRQVEYRVGGRRTLSYSISWVIPLRPSREGEYEIPPIEVEFGGRRHGTQPLHLKVVTDMRGEELGLLEVKTSTPHLVDR